MVLSFWEIQNSGKVYASYMLAISKVYQRQVMSRSKILYSMANANHKSYATSE